MELQEYIQIYGTSILVIIITFILGIIPIKLREKKNKKYSQKIERKHYDKVQEIYNIINDDVYMHKKRKEYQNILIVLITIIILIIIIAILLSKYIYATTEIAIFAIIVTTIISIKKANEKKKEYTDYYKENIIRIVLKEYNSSYTYNPYGIITETMYTEAEFENKEQYDIYNSEDRIDGNINGLNFVMAEINLQREEKDNEGHKYYVTVFNGPVAIITIPEFINVNLAIVNNRTKPNNMFLNQIEIDNPIFEEIYNVYSDNQILAMRILTPAITNKIMDLFNQYKMYFEIRIKNNTFYFRFRTRDLFTPNIKDSKEEATTIIIYLEMLKAIEEIMKEIMQIAKSLKDM